jgi:ubiquitin carboxyl-terminal hydrolase 7
LFPLLTGPKINDRHEFPYEIDLEEYLDESADRTESYVYKLHGVLVHSGDLHGGHYFALIKPDTETRWLKYDDDRVTPVTDKEVLDDNYGGESTNGLLQYQRQQVRTMKRFTNAYMLVYIRECKLEEVLGNFTEADTPVHLSEWRIGITCRNSFLLRADDRRGTATGGPKAKRT